MKVVSQGFTNWKNQKVIYILEKQIPLKIKNGSFIAQLFNFALQYYQQ